MAFEDNIKKITPELTDIASNTPAVKVGDKVLVAGIGGNSIPGASVQQVEAFQADMTAIIGQSTEANT